MKYERLLVAANVIIGTSQAVQVFLNYRQNRRQEERIEENHAMNMRYLEWQMRPYDERLKETFSKLDKRQGEEAQR